MSNNGSRRQLREFFSSKYRRVKDRLYLSAPMLRHTPMDSTIPSISKGDSPPTLPTNIALGLQDGPIQYQTEDSETLEQTSGQGDPEGEYSERLPQAAGAKNSLVASHSLWALAYEELKGTNRPLVEKFNYCLGITTTSADRDNEICVGPNIGEVVRNAFHELDKAYNLRVNLDHASPVRKRFEQALKVINASKDYISSAVSLNPYAALAWTGVNLLLSLLLNPSLENEAAIRGLDYIANLMIVYRWQEKAYLGDDDHDAVSDFQDSTKRLYSKILEFEATLLVYMHRNLSERWVRGVIKADDWTSRLEHIKLCEAQCRNVTNAIDGVQVKNWRRVEEQKWQERLIQQPRKAEEKSNIRMLYSNYEAGKNVNPEATPGTCQWFLKHTDFLTWRESQSPRLLWLSADPGCGKSVLSKYLVDRKGEVLTVNTATPIICYFFFKDGDVDRMHGTKAICAMLHQLIMQQPDLYRFAKEDFDTKSQMFLNDFGSLWNIFLTAIANVRYREVLCVLDALDECQALSRTALITKLVDLFRHSEPSKSRKPIFKLLATSRPEFQTIRDFEGLTEVRLRGEDESEEISQEIDLVIRDKVKKLGSMMSESDKSELVKNLTSIPHRTYLWLYLTFDYIKDKLEFTKDEIATIAKTIPQNVEQAYNAILDKSPDIERARRLLHIILAAFRPLTLAETNIAMAIEGCNKSYRNLDIWWPGICEDRIKNICGLFLSVVDSRVYLIHQTAREFLVRKKRAEPSLVLHVPSSDRWKESFCPSESDLLMAKICIGYLQLQDFKEEELRSNKCYYSLQMREFLIQPKTEVNKYTLLSYATQHWAAHFTQAENLPDPALVEAVAYSMYDTHSNIFETWFCFYTFTRTTRKYTGLPSNVTNVLLGAYFGHGAVVELLLKRNDVQTDREEDDGYTPLWWAARKGHKVVARLLLEREDVHVNTQATSAGTTPLGEAVVWGHVEVVRLLLNRKDVHADWTDKYNRSVLSIAVAKGYETIVRLLLERADVQINSKDVNGRTAFSVAAEFGHKAIVELLLVRHEIELDSKDNEGQTPLS